MTTKWTPAPWLIDSLSAINGMEIKGANGDTVVVESDYFHFPEEMCSGQREQVAATLIANARLISKAPEMAELLRELRKAAVALVWEPMGTTGDESDWFACQICGGRTRGISKGHTDNCVMVRTERLLKEIES